MATKDKVDLGRILRVHFESLHPLKPQTMDEDGNAVKAIQRFQIKYKSWLFWKLIGVEEEMTNTYPGMLPPLSIFREKGLTFVVNNVCHKTLQRDY